MPEHQNTSLLHVQSFGRGHRVVTHRCVFDSDYGLIPGRWKLALMCACGRWAMPASGRWEGVPKELLPKACRTLTWFHKLFWALGKNAFGIAFVAVMVLFLFLV